jgi:hypothetical protein
MAQYVRPMHKRISKIIGSFAVAQVSQAINIGGLNATLQVITGNLWINDKIPAVANSTSFALTSTVMPILDINADTLNIISDVTGATVQIIVWED